MGLHLGGCSMLDGSGLGYSLIRAFAKSRTASSLTRLQLTRDDPLIWNQKAVVVIYVARLCTRKGGWLIIHHGHGMDL
jgi:hypothetical protein